MEGDGMEKFISLPEEKQIKIINAGLNAFGTNGYKKASISDIANTAGISKSMVFHYFGTKKYLYIFLAEYSGNTLVNEINRRFNKNETDFFERIRLATEIEVSVMRKHPSILSFLKSLYLETDEEVAGEIKDMLSRGESLRSYIGLNGVDMSKFREGVDPALVMKMLVWSAEGYINQLGNKKEMDIDEINSEFELCLDMLKQNLYREEFL
jgi:AcrR family transcriptional regulator